MKTLCFTWPHWYSRSRVHAIQSERPYSPLHARAAPSGFDELSDMFYTRIFDYSHRYRFRCSKCSVSNDPKVSPVIKTGRFTLHLYPLPSTHNARYSSWMLLVSVQSRIREGLHRPNRFRNLEDRCKEAPEILLRDSGWKETRDLKRLRRVSGNMVESARSLRRSSIVTIRHDHAKVFYSIAPEQKGSLADADPWKGAFRVTGLLFHGVPVRSPSSLIPLEEVESSFEIKPDEKPAGVTLFSTSSAPRRGPSRSPESHPRPPLCGHPVGPVQDPLIAPRIFCVQWPIRCWVFRCET